MAARSREGDRLLTVEAAAERMSTSARFIRRLIAERRIARRSHDSHVRIAEADIVAFIETGRVDAIDMPAAWPGRKRSA